MSRGWNFIKELVGVGSPLEPAYANASEWWRVGQLAYDTLAMSVLAILIAGIGALLTFMFGAHNVMLGELSPHSGWKSRMVFGSVRASWAFVRSVPE